jgi:hypothetical protein
MMVTNKIASVAPSEISGVKCGARRTCLLLLLIGMGSLYWVMYIAYEQPMNGANLSTEPLSTDPGEPLSNDPGQHTADELIVDPPQNTEPLLSEPLANDPARHIDDEFP